MVQIWPTARPLLLVDAPFEVALASSNTPAGNATPGSGPSAGPGASPGGGAAAGAGSGGAGSGSSGGSGGDAGAGGSDGGGGDQGEDNSGSGDTSPAGPITFIQTQQQIAPVFAVQPEDQDIIANDDASFTARASGYPAYQWQVSPDGVEPFDDISNSGIFSGATSDTLRLHNVPIEYSGYVFKCTAYNLGGQATSDNATLTISAPADKPYIINDPQNTNSPDGGTANFSVTADGSAPLSYQWQISANGGTTWINVPDSSPYTGQNTDTLTIDPVADSLDNHIFRCRVRNAFGTVFSNSAMLTIGDVPVPECFISPNAQGYISTIQSGCISSGDPECLPLVYPRVFYFPITTSNVIVSCECGDPDAIFISTARVRLTCGNLVIGHSYRATIFLIREDQDEPTAQHDFIFVASSETEQTPYADIPNPSGTGQPGWNEQGCEIVPL